MKISKITKEQVKDILVRTVKTFVAAGLTAATASINESTSIDAKAVIFVFGTAGITALMNVIAKAFEKGE
jgi:ABC-type molybdate transport system substrate-binding protein